MEAKLKEVSRKDTSLDERLEDTAKAGDIKWLYTLFKEDPKLLDRIDDIAFVDTPLHIASLNKSNSLDEWLEATAKAGDIDLLYTLIKEDPKLLDRIDEIPFVDTPLHTAASLGHIQFSMEIMRLKPSFARKPNPDGFTPLHVALRNKKTEMVRRLVEVDNELIRVKGREGKTALHCAAEGGNEELLKIFLQACPSSIEDVTIERKTAFHIALEKQKFKALEFLIAYVRNSIHESSEKQEKLVLNTLLHDAAAISQLEAVEFLLKVGVDLNAKNSEGLTALDVVKRDTQETNREARQVIEKMLINAGAKTSEHPTCATSTTTNHTNSLDNISVVKTCGAATHNYKRSKLSWLDRLVISIYRSRMKMSDDVRSILLVVAVLIATAAYQVSLSPPGGLWQDNDGVVDSSSHANKIPPQVLRLWNLLIYNMTILPKHTAGKVIMDVYPFTVIEVLNSVAFFISTLAILFLLPPVGYISQMLFVPLFLIFFSYVLSMANIAPKTSVVGVWFQLVFLTFLAQLLLWVPIYIHIHAKRKLNNLKKI